jgi:RNA polymerase sigma-70 factor, ECF subfamily
MKLLSRESRPPLMDLWKGERETGTRFEEYFERYWESTVRIILRIVGDPAEAEDLALETFQRLYQRQPDPNSDFNIKGWLFRVGTNLGLQSIRSFRRRSQYEGTAGRGMLDEAPEDRPAEILERKEEHRTARAALGRMPPRQSQLLVMRYSGMAYQEIADALGLAPTSIGPLLLRAEREFEKHYRALSPEEP